MRRKIDLQDFEDSHEFKVSADGVETKKTVKVNTEEFMMKNMSIETVVKSYNKQSFGIQIDAHTIVSEIQKDELERSPSKSHRKQEMEEGDNGNEGEEENQQGESAEMTKKIIKFLRKIGPLMQDEISEHLPLYSKFGVGEETAFFRRQSRLMTTLENMENASEDNLQISDVSWNATGVIVAACYAKTEHQGACNHKSLICLWGLYKRNFKPTKPDIIRTPNCINCMIFHPRKPSILACGSYTGEVLLYDYSKLDEQLLAKTTVDDYFHRGSISQVRWCPFLAPGRPDPQYNVLSLGTDGKLLLWEIPNQSIIEDAQPKAVKMLLKYPIKGFLMLRKKEGETVPVSGLAIHQTKMNKNVFIVGSEGGSLLRATLHPINHYLNTESKVVLDVQQSVKFKNAVYPFLLNILPKHLPEVKAHVEKYCAKNKIREVDSMTTVFQSLPEIRNLYPNPITYAFEPMSFPIFSLSDNKYGLVIVNAYEGYNRIYHESCKSNLESIEEGYEWGWVNNSHLMGGFVGQEWVVVDWTTGLIIWSVGVGEGVLWREKNLQVAITCDKTKVKIVELGDKLISAGDSQQKYREVMKKIDELKVE